MHQSLTIILLVLFQIVSLNAYSQVRFYLPGNDSDTLDFGLVSDDTETVIKNVIIENNSNRDYYIDVVSLGSITVVGPSGRDVLSDNFDVDIYNPSGVVTIPAGGSIEWKVGFRSENFNEVNDPFGVYDAFLDIGVLADPDNKNDLAFSKRYLLVARVSNQDFDFWSGAENLKNVELDASYKSIKFDSVFINPTVPVTSKLYFRNNSENVITIESGELEIISTVEGGEEFESSEKQFPITIGSRSEPGIDPENIDISYLPINRGADSAFYHFVINNNGEQTQESATISGFGIEQQLSILNYSSGTATSSRGYLEIDLGQISRSNTYNLQVELQNTGNIDFESRLIEFSNGLIGSGDFSGKNSVYSNPLDIFNIDLEFQIQSIGNFVEKVSLTSELSDRNYGGYSDSQHSAVDIFIKGFSTDPAIQVFRDTLDFGTATGNEDCVGIESLIREVINIGNEDLEISVLTSSNAFSAFTDKSVIAPNDTARIEVVFSGASNSDIINETLIIRTNTDEDNIEIPIKAIFVQSTPINLTSINQTFFPGNQIAVPLITEGSRIVIADRFKTFINFESTLLSYSSFNRQNTASDGSSFATTVQEISPGRLEIDISMPNDQFFSDNNTMIELIFDTYISKIPSTEISFDGTSFGDDNCDDLFPINSSNSIVAIDSLCGLEEIIDFLNAVEVRNIYPLPTTDKINILLDSKHTGSVQIQLINTSGNVVSDQYITVIEDENHITMDISKFSSGIYSLMIRSGNNTYIKTIGKY